MEATEGALESLSTMSIRVTDTERRKNGTDSYVAYNIETKVPEADSGLPKGSYDVWRRFSDFVTLREHLERTYPGVVLAPMPPKAVSVGAKSADFVEKRRMRLEAFLRRVASHPTLARDEYFTSFLSADDWQQVKAKKGIDMKLGAPKVKERHAGFQAIETKAKDMRAVFAAAVKLHDAIRKKQQEIQATYGANGKLYGEWAGLDTEFAGVLQATATFMDNMGGNLAAKTDEEDVGFGEALNEYEQLMDSVIAVVNAHLTKQGDAERQTDLVAAKNIELMQLERTGGAAQGLMSVFQKKQTAEQNQERLEKFRQSVEEEKQKKEQQEHELEEFTAVCEHELQFFERVKVKELRQTLVRLMKMQLEFLDKQEKQWETLRQAYESF
eukprot:comp12235_c0_seq1/m.7025 comp12235_c0_seq1/g.7025  ORF comp12235_c0_seq1/g.7025 comp12235_c0_seq1/m.7025 type:complete len:384 (-) comp12235_c0_seq1:292-1443(-)